MNATTNNVAQAVAAAVAADAIEAAIEAAEGFQSFQMEVNEKVVIAGKPQYKALGKIAVFVPLLSAFGIKAVQEVDDKDQALVDDEGFPVYTDEKLNWLQGTVIAAVKAMARNRLQPKTLTLKDGCKIASNFEELLAAADRSNSGAALVAIRELKSLFAEWVAKMGKSAAARQTLKTLFNSKESLALQSETNRTKMQQYVADFAETLDAERLAKSEKFLQGLLDACAANVDANDF